MHYEVFVQLHGNILKRAGHRRTLPLFLKSIVTFLQIFATHNGTKLCDRLRR